jgi:hypothetical protein
MHFEEGLDVAVGGHSGKRKEESSFSEEKEAKRL